MGTGRIRNGDGEMGTEGIFINQWLNLNPSVPFYPYLEEEKLGDGVWSTVRREFTD
jgi:hypothetical protein